MLDHVDGRLEEPFELVDDQRLEVNGSVEAGGRIATGGVLTVNGAIGGGDVLVDLGGTLLVNGAAGGMTIEVRRGGYVAIEGAFGGGRVVLHDGAVLAISGVFQGSLPMRGIVLVKPETILVVGDHPVRVHADGRLERMPNSVKDVTIDSRYSWNDALRLMPDGSFSKAA